LKSSSIYELKILHEIQYNFPLTLTPYKDISKRIGVPVDYFLETLRELKSTGLIKRIGFYLNYRARKQHAALIALSTNGYYDDIVSELRRDPQTTHVYVRDHPVYDLWIVSKRRSRNALIKLAEGLASRYGVDKWLVLFGVRTWKLSVKYDILEGVSKSLDNYTVPPRETKSLTDEELYLAKRFRDLPLNQRPYLTIGESVGISEEEVHGTMKKLLNIGVLGDPGAALDGRKLGFKENGMLMISPGSGNYEALCNCLADNRYTTHVIEREPYPPESSISRCFAMIHAVNKDKLESILKRVISMCRPGEWLLVKSLEDLKPGVVR
jgi:DNA-binding Lrp family transcriptional regulator